MLGRLGCRLLVFVSWVPMPRPETPRSHFEQRRNTEMEWASQNYGDDPTGQGAGRVEHKVQDSANLSENVGDGDERACGTGGRRPALTPTHLI